MMDEHEMVGALRALGYTVEKKDPWALEWKRRCERSLYWERALFGVGIDRTLHKFTYVRIVNALSEAKIESLEQLRAMTEAEILRLPHLGRATFEVLAKAFGPFAREYV